MIEGIDINMLISLYIFGDRSCKRALLSPISGQSLTIVSLSKKGKYVMKDFDQMGVD